jgi:hypothetical protein
MIKGRFVYSDLWNTSSELCSFVYGSFNGVLSSSVYTGFTSRLITKYFSGKRLKGLIPALACRYRQRIQTFSHDSKAAGEKGLRNRSSLWSNSAAPSTIQANFFLVAFRKQPVIFYYYVKRFLDSLNSLNSHSLILKRGSERASSVHLYDRYKKQN